jgi:hypothetical protein
LMRACTCVSKSAYVSIRQYRSVYASVRFLQAAPPAP